jgi:hypothetical protein
MFFTTGNMFNYLYVLCNFAGDVVLQDLVLKGSALDDLALPVKTIYGTLGITTFVLRVALN